MTRYRVGWLLASVAILGVGFAAARTSEPVPPGVRAVVHVNFSDSGRQGHGLKNIENILKEVGDQGASLVVVCHGGGITLLERARTEHAEQVSALMARGVRFEACRNTMRRYSLREEDLLPGVTTVPAGALEVIRKQHEGYAYFRP